MSSAFVFCPADVFCYVVSVLAMFFRRVPFGRVNLFPTVLFPDGRASFYRVVYRHIFMLQPLVFNIVLLKHFLGTQFVTCKARGLGVIVETSSGGVKVGWSGQNFEIFQIFSFKAQEVGFKGPYVSRCGGFESAAHFGFY